MNKRQKKKCRHKMAVMKAGKTLYIDEFHLAYKLPTVDNVVLVLSGTHQYKASFLPS